MFPLPHARQVRGTNTGGRSMLPLPHVCQVRCAPLQRGAIACIRLQQLTAAKPQLLEFFLAALAVICGHRS